MASVAPESLTIVRSDLNPCTIELTVTCSTDQVSQGFQKALKKASKEIRVPGFRPGMAPTRMVEQMVDPEALSREAADFIVRPAFDVAIRESGLTPHGTPRLNLVDFSREPAVCVFSVKVGLEPMVAIGEYKGIEVARELTAVTEEEIERQIDEFRRRSGKKVAVRDRGAQPGDMAVVNIKPEGEEANNFMVVVGQSFESLDKALAGMDPEGIKAALLNFPDDFQQKAWAGSSLECTITVRSLTEVSSAEANDEFAQTMKAENMSDLRAQVRAGLERMKLDAANEMLTEQILEKLIGSSTIHVADNTWEEVAERRLQEMDEELRRQKSTLATYVENHGMTIDQFVAAQQEEAKVHVRRAVVVEKLFRDEDLKITENDVNHQFLKVASENRVPEEQLERFAKEYGPQMRDELIFRAMFAVVTQFLIENAKVTDTAVATPSAPTEKSEAAKKPKAKKKTE